MFVCGGTRSGFLYIHASVLFGFTSHVAVDRVLSTLPDSVQSVLVHCSLMFLWVSFWPCVCVYGVLLNLNFLSDLRTLTPTPRVRLVFDKLAFVVWLGVGLCLLVSFSWLYFSIPPINNTLCQFSLSDLLDTLWSSLDSTLLQMAFFHSFLCLSNFPRHIWSTASVFTPVQGLYVCFGALALGKSAFLKCGMPVLFQRMHFPEYRAWWGLAGSRGRCWFCSKGTCLHRGWSQFPFPGAAEGGIPFSPCGSPALIVLICWWGLPDDSWL